MSDERGAIAVTVAVLMVVLIGFAALAIDIGALYQERQTLQNGADAGALAVAKDCAGAGCGAFEDTAGLYADENADDGRSDVDEVCGVGPDLIGCPVRPTVPAGTVGYVQVTTSTYEVSSPDNPTEVNFNFAPVFDLVAPGDHDGKTMRARAVAAWGPPRSATTLPLTISMCEYERIGLDLTPPFRDSLVHFHGPLSPAGSCPMGPAGSDLPGGFGWLDDGPGCDEEIDIEVGELVDDKTGAAAPTCLDLDQLRDATVLVPVYTDTNGLTGTNGEYRIVGFAAFHVSGYRFPGGNVYPPGLRCPPNPGFSGTCLRGYFTGFTTTGTGFGGPDLGVNIIKLVG